MFHSVYADAYIIYLILRAYIHVYTTYLHICMKITTGTRVHLIETQMEFFLWVYDLVKQKFRQFLLNSYSLQEETATPTATGSRVSLKMPSGQPNPTVFS
jgi:hypothetical protein